MSGLHVPRGVGLGTGDLSSSKKMFSTMEQSDEYARRVGAVTGSKPIEAIPSVTAEMLSDADPRTYSAHYAQQLAWYNYLTPILAELKGDLLQAENTLEMIGARIKRGLYDQNKVVHKSEKMTADEIDVEIKNDPDYRDALIRVQELSQKKLLIDAAVSNVERNLKVVSRQVEIRKLEFDSSNREGGVQGVRHGRIDRR